MKLVNYKQVKEKKYTAGFFFGGFSLICLFTAMKFVMALVITSLLLDDIAFLRFIKDSIGVKGLATTVTIVATLFSLLFTASAYRAFVFADKRYFSKLKYGIVFKIILCLLPLLLIPLVRSDVAKFKNPDNIKQKAKEYISNNPLEFIKQQNVDYDLFGYLVFDENKEPYFILKKLKEAKNKAKIDSDFLYMDIYLDLAIEGDSYHISNLSISGKVKHSNSNLIEMTKENLPAMTSTQIIAQATIPSINQETSEPCKYQVYILFYKKAIE